MAGSGGREARAGASSVAIMVLLWLALQAAPPAAAAHCGTLVTPVEWGPMRAPAGPVTLRAVFEDEPPHCGVHGYHFAIDGEPCYNCGSVTMAGSRYAIEHTFTLGKGAYAVTAVVREGNACPDCAHGIVSWTLHVGDACGAGALSPARASPTGTVADRRPLIEAWFEDPDTACGLGDAIMTLNGVEVEPTVTAEGAHYKVQYLPASPLAPGAYSVAVQVTEACCNPQGGGNQGAMSWSFSVLVLDSGDPVAVDEHVYGFTQRARTPDSVENPHRVCHPASPPHVVCLDSFRETVPFANATFVLAPTRLQLGADPWAEERVPGRAVGPLRFCDPYCPLPAPRVDDVRVETTLRVRATLSDQTTLVDVDQPILLALP